ncbi:MAG: hypothetical protein ABI479_03625 [Gallionella sp.]
MEKTSLPCFACPLFSLGASRRVYVNCVFSKHGFLSMNDSSTLIADGAAEHIVRHFQSKGFTGITEALIIQIRLREGDRAEVEAAFEAAHDQDKMPPVQKYFEIHPYGHFSDFRSFAEAKSAINSDVTMSLRSEIPRVYFDPAPVVIEDPLASGTKYDAIMKLRDNVDGYAVAILMNDPDASFLDYIGTHLGSDWQKIMGEFEIASASLGDEIDLH